MAATQRADRAKGVALLDGPLVSYYMSKYQAAENAYEDDMMRSGQLQEQADTLFQAASCPASRIA